MSSYRWQRYTAAERLLRYLAYLITASVLFWAVSDLDIYWPWVWDAPVQIGDLLGRMTPPKLSGLREIGAALIETVHIATLATALSLFLALPTAYIAAQNTTPNRVLLWLGRFIVVSTRSVNTIIWALLFVAIFGPGVVAGILAIAFRSVGFVGKLMAEAIEEIDPGQVEAVRASGAGFFKVLAYAVFPQVLPRQVGLSIYQLDSNLRASAIVGIVGAGGIGGTLMNSFRRFDYDFSLAILIVMIVIILISEALSARIRGALT